LWGLPEYNPNLVASDEAKAGVVSGEGLYLISCHHFEEFVFLRGGL